MRLILLPLCAFSIVAARSETATLMGTVRDAGTGEPLAAANVRILGTSRGTITNSAGEYSLSIDTGECRLLFTMLGYAPDTAALRVGGDMRHDVQMTPSDIVLPEVVITPEDPAIGIIRRAIDNKQKWIDRLRSYQMHAFTRLVLYRDSAVAGVDESYTNGYWQQGDTLREIVTQHRQTANLPASFYLAAVNRITNFLDDRITLIGYSFVGPTAADALEYYDYKLVRTRPSGSIDLYEIRMIPRTRTAPLFDGTVTIASGTYALVGVDVEPNAAFEIPLLSDITFRYRQQFDLYESSYWMPTDIRIEAGFMVSVMGITTPRIGISQTSVISDYAINPAIPDSIFRRPRLVVDSAATRFDSTYWARNTVLPLDSQQVRAYRTLDSTQTLASQFALHGGLLTISAGAGSAGAALSNLDVMFNRVEGLHLGALADMDSLTRTLSVKAGLAYGFSDRLPTYNAQVTYYTDTGRTFGAGAGLYRAVDHTPDHGYCGPFENSLSALIEKEDFFDYYRADGGTAFLLYRPSSLFHAAFSYRLEDERSLGVRTNFSLIYPSRPFRSNPAVRQGRLRAIELKFRIGHDAVPYDLVMVDGLDVAIEHSSPGLTGGDFDYTRYDGVLSLSIPTFGRSYLLPPGFRLRAFAGASTGSLPPQRIFSVESSIFGYAPLGVMHGLGPREFTGTGYASVFLEHNFRTIPFLALGIPFLYKNHLEVVVFGGAARTWGIRGVPVSATEGVYTEAGFGISRIFDILRIDCTWRLSAPRGVCVSYTFAGFF